jgi:hypothetical protein
MSGGLAKLGAVLGVVGRVILTNPLLLALFALGGLALPKLLGLGGADQDQTGAAAPRHWSGYDPARFSGGAAQKPGPSSGPGYAPGAGYGPGLGAGYGYGPQGGAGQAPARPVGQPAGQSAAWVRADAAARRAGRALLSTPEQGGMFSFSAAGAVSPSLYNDTRNLTTNNEVNNQVTVIAKSEDARGIARETGRELRHLLIATDKGVLS